MGNIVGIKNVLIGKDMKFRIRKEDGLYLAEYKWMFSWWFISDSISKNIEKTREACRQFEKPKIVEKFKL